MDRLYSSVEITSWENNELAIENAIEVLKGRLRNAPEGVLNDVLQRCDPNTHESLVAWIHTRLDRPTGKRVPRTWSPNKNRSLWVLYAAANLDRPERPPRA